MFSLLVRRCWCTCLMVDTVTVQRTVRRGMRSTWPSPNMIRPCYVTDARTLPLKPAPRRKIISWIWAMVSGPVIRMTIRLLITSRFTSITAPTTITPVSLRQKTCEVDKERLYLKVLGAPPVWLGIIISTANMSSAPSSRTSSPPSALTELRGLCWLAPELGPGGSASTATMWRRRWLPSTLRSMFAVCWTAQTWCPGGWRLRTARAATWTRWSCSSWSGAARWTSPVCWLTRSPSTPPSYTTSAACSPGTGTT